MENIAKFAQVRVVMVGTSHPGNIGAAARAMKVMGLSDLVLVKPRCEINDETVALASKAADIVASLTIVDTLDEALADTHFSVGASARIRGFELKLQSPRDSAALMADLLSSNAEHKVAWVLGREDSGLSNTELARCNAHVHIPTNPEYSSLNVASALQVLAYETRLALMTEGATNADEPLAKSAAFEGFLGHLETAMVQSGFHDPAEPKQTMLKLRYLFNKAQMTDAEISLMRGILGSMMKK